MSPSLFFDNKKYISAKEASLLTGYSQDYVGQLVRSKKIDSKRVGRVWYVGEESILKYNNLKKYISAKEAGSLTGYSRDYIGQLARSKKIDSKRVGRVWYVGEESILKYNDLLVNSKIFIESESTLGIAKKTIKKIPNQEIPLLKKRKLLLLTSGLLLLAGIFYVSAVNFPDTLKNISSIPENFLSAILVKSITPPPLSYDSLATAYKNYVSPTPSLTSTINISDLATAYKNYLSPVLSPASTINISDLISAYKNYISKPTKIIYAQGSAGPAGPQGPIGLQGPAGNSLDPSIFIPRTFFDSQVDGIFSSISNSTRGLAGSLAKEVDTKLLAVSGNVTVGGDLTSVGNTTLATGANKTNTFGTGTGATNTIGEATGTNAINGSTTILGTTLINSTGTSATTIGNSTGVLTVASGGVSGWTNTAGDLTIQTATSGNTTLDSAGILNLGTVNSTATNLGNAATTLTINPIAWTATPTISGLITATSGLTSNGVSTFNNNLSQVGDFTFSTGTGVSTLGGDVSLTAASPLLNSTAGTLSINTTNNNPVTFGTGLVTINNFASSSVAITGGAISNTTIGLVNPSTGAFTTLTSSGNTTLGTGINTTNTFGSGASSVNTIGSVTTPGTLTLHGVTTLNNTFSQTGAYTFDTGTGAVSLNGATAVTGTNTFTVGTGLAMFNGNAILGTNSANTLAINSVIASDVIPAGNTRDFGSDSNRWEYGYFTNVDATNISGVIITGSTTSNSWTINTDNVTNNAEIASLVFRTGTLSPINAVLQWNAANDPSKIVGFDNSNLFNFPIAIYSKVNGANQTFTSGSLFKFSQPASDAITQSGAFIGVNIDFSSNLTVPNNASGNQTGFLTTLKDGGAGATVIGFQTAGTLDYGLDLGGTIGTADIRLSKGETIDNLTDGTILLTAATTKTSGDLTVGTAGTGTITSGLINGQTISSAANFTGTLVAATSLSAPRLISTVAMGTAPLTITSTTVVPNLNSDLLDGYQAGNATGNVPVSNGTVNTNLNADMADGYHFNQGLQTTNAPTFAGLTLTGALALGANTITSGLINGQTISNAANFTGTLNAASIITGASFTGAGTGLTGTASSLTTGTVTTNANLTGDVTSVGNATTLATVATGATTGSSTAIPIITFNNKGLVTGVTTAAVIAPAGTLSGATLNSGVTASSLTSVGTLTSLTLGGALAMGANAITSTGTISSGLINGQTISSAANFTGTINAASTITAPTFSGALSGNATTATTAGTVTTAAQPNITSVGTLTSLTSSGIITGSQFNGSGAGLNTDSVPIASMAHGDYSGNITSGTYGINISGSANQVDGYDETAFVRLAPSSSNPTNGNFAIGSASGRNFIQSHSSQPLDINPLGNAVTINGNTPLTSGNYNSYSPTLTGTGASGNWAINSAGLYGSPNITTGTITSGLINGQTISSAANFTGSLTTATAINTTSGPYQIGGVTRLSYTSSYTTLHDGAGRIAMYIGSADPGNYYDNTNHYFRAIATGTTFATINASGIAANVGSFSGAGTGLTGTAASLTAGAATTATNFNNGTSYSSGGNVYATTFSGALSGNATSATTAATANAVSFNGGLTTGSTPTFAAVQLGAGGYVGLNGGTTYGIGVIANRNSAVFDTVDTVGGDPLQLVYYSTGAGVTVGDSGTDHPLTVYGTVTGGTYNGQTISSAANFTGTIVAAGTVTTPSVYMTPNSNSPYTNSSWVRAAASSGVFLTNNSVGTWAGIRSDDAFEVSGKSYLLGNVGIGTTDPGAKLTVNGDMRYTLASGSLNTTELWGAIYRSIGFTDGGYQNTVYSNSSTNEIVFKLVAPADITGGTVTFQVTNYADGSTRTATAYYSKNDYNYTAGTPVNYGGTGGIDVPITIPNLGQPYVYVKLMTPGTTGSSYFGLQNLTYTLTTSGSMTNVGFEHTGMIVGSSGNVGIGTTGPVTKLDILGSTGLPLGGWLDTTSNGMMRMEAGGSSGTIMDMGISGTKGWIQVSEKDNLYGDPSFNLLLNPNQGNVGIGTIAPGNRLDVAGGNIGLTSGAASTDMRVNNSTGGLTNSDFYMSEMNTGEAQLRLYGAYPMSFWTNNTQKMTILSGGNVGIGTTAPLSKLSVGGVGLDYAGIYVTGSNVGVYAAAAGGTGVLGTGAEGIHGTGTSYGVYAVGTDAGTGVRGVSSTGYGVSGVSSGVGVSGSGGNYDFYALGTGVDYGTTSSIRWKNNIQPIDNALEKVLNLSGVYYDWDTAHGGQHDMGMIAEDVGKIVPEIVGWDPDAPGYATGMDYGHLTPILVEAIKEMNLNLEGVAARVAVLEASAGGSSGSIESLGQYAVDFFKAGVQGVTDGIVYLKSIVVEKLTVGSPTKRTGITLYDEVTGDPYCLSVANGVQKTIPGECAVFVPAVASVIVAATVATCSDGIKNQDETAVDVGGVCTTDTTVPATLQSISITAPATKLSYTVGDTLDISGLEVTGTYSDTSTKVETITADNISGFDSTTLVTGQVLTVTLGEKTTTYTIDIIVPATLESSL